MNTFDEAAHAKLAARLSTNKADRCVIYWEIGVALNRDYGSPTDPIPASEMQKLTKLYGVGQCYISAMRRFAYDPDSNTATKARAVVAEYGSWSPIVNDFLRGRDPGETQEQARQNRAATPVAPPASSTAENTPASSQSDEDVSRVTVGARSFVVPQAVIENIAPRFGWTTEFTAKIVRTEVDRHRPQVENFFADMLKRAGHKQVTRTVA